MNATVERRPSIRGVDTIAVSSGGDFFVDAHYWTDDDDFATTTYVWARDMPCLKARLGSALAMVIETDAELLSAVKVRFPSTSEIRQWLEMSGVPFSYRFDDGARLGPFDGPLPTERVKGPDLGPRLVVSAKE